jgi:hypothetical protein
MSVPDNIAADVAARIAGHVLQGKQAYNSKLASSSSSSALGDWSGHVSDSWALVMFALAMALTGAQLYFLMELGDTDVQLSGRGQGTVYYTARVMQRWQRYEHAACAALLLLSVYTRHVWLSLLLLPMTAIVAYTVVNRSGGGSGIGYVAAGSGDVSDRQFMYRQSAFYWCKVVTSGLTSIYLLFVLMLLLVEYVLPKLFF